MTLIFLQKRNSWCSLQDDRPVRVIYKTQKIPENSWDSTYVFHSNECSVPFEALAEFFFLYSVDFIRFYHCNEQMFSANTKKLVITIFFLNKKILLIFEKKQRLKVFQAHRHKCHPKTTTKGWQLRRANHTKNLKQKEHPTAKPETPKKQTKEQNLKTIKKTKPANLELKIPKKGMHLSWNRHHPPGQPHSPNHQEHLFFFFFPCKFGLLHFYKLL